MFLALPSEANAHFIVFSWAKCGIFICPAFIITGLAQDLQNSLSSCLIRSTFILVIVKVSPMLFLAVKIIITLLLAL